MLSQGGPRVISSRAPGTGSPLTSASAPARAARRFLRGELADAIQVTNSAAINDQPLLPSCDSFEL
jgi:hypothetical protein